MFVPVDILEGELNHDFCQTFHSGYASNENNR